MRTKIIAIIIALAIIFLLTFFGFGLKERAISGMVSSLPEYGCSKNNFCTSCIIEGNVCRCSQYTCDCGNRTVDKKECLFF